MTKNRLTDLNDHLFAQIERLSDENLKGDELKEETGRAKAITAVARETISNATLLLDAEKFRHERGYGGRVLNDPLPHMLEKPNRDKGDQ